MKYFFIVLTLISFIFIACHQKTLPVITERKSQSPSLRVNDTTQLVADIEAGRVLFNNRCSRCHGLPQTDQFTAKKWEMIMVTMAPRARLSNQQEWDVLGYVKANAAK